MKGRSYFLPVILLLVVAACGNRSRSSENTVVDGTDTTLKKTTIHFAEPKHDFGQVNEGEKVVNVFEFTNTGDSDLVLQSVRASCGCTTPEYDQKPVRPGRKGSIEVVFNTKGRPGKQQKTVTVITNTEPPTTILSFTCEVLPSEKK